MVDDTHHMRHALRLAERGLGRVAPNPSVGCVIVSADGRVLGRGTTGDGGRPHAETIALEQAGASVRGGTVYATLEPCAHHGETPPCAEALVRASPARVVVAVEDPDPRVNGAGIAQLRKAGIEVRIGVLAGEASRINAGFFRRVRDKRPLVTLKIAQSIDGKTTAASGESTWITGEHARRFGHLLRARHDAILIGIETALADDPELTCRIPGLERQSPVRVILDTRLRLRAESRLARSANKIPTLVYSVAGDSRTLRAAGVEIVPVARDVRGRPDLGAVLNDLASRGITRLLVEGGAGVHAAFVDRGFVDRLEVFRSPIFLGDAGRSAVDAIAAFTLEEAPRFRSVARRMLGPDLLESFEARA